MSDSFRCPNCPKQIRLQKSPREGEKLKCPVCHFEFKWSHALSSANVPAVHHDSQPMQRESLPAVRHDSAPARRENTSTVGRQVSAIKRRVIQAVTPGLVVAQKKNSAIAEPSVPSWYESPNGYGQLRPLADLTPQTTELRVWHGVCSGTGKPWSKVYMKTQLGQRFREVDGEDSGTYLRMARANNIHVCDGEHSTFSLAELDLCGFQCTCGWGRITGASRNTFWCSNCGISNCARSVLEPRGAPSTALCGKCGLSGVLEPGSNMVNGVSHVARRA
jgi:transcription elongation factor Elf1